MAHVGPVGTGGEPLTVLWAWRQAQLEQHDRAASPRPRRVQDQPKDSLAQDGPTDGPKPGDQGYLTQLQQRLRETVKERAVVARLAEVPAEQRTVLHSAIAADPAAAERGFVWLLEHFDQPSAVVPHFAQLAPALDALIGPRSRQLDLFGEALVAAVRDTYRGEWSDDNDGSWREGWRFVVGWLRQAKSLQQEQIPFWTATVLAHDQRRDDVAVLRLATDLPYPARSGQRAVVEHPMVPGSWRSCWISAPPTDDNRLELHVQAMPSDDATGALVHGTRVGDRVRLHRAEGEFVIEKHGRAILIVAEDVHVAPVKALLDELAARQDERVVHLFWGVSTREDLYDLESLRAHAAQCAHATVHAVVARGPAHPYLSGSLPQVVVDFAEWTSHDVYLCGTPFGVGVMRNMLLERSVPAGRIHSVTLERLARTPSSR
ncbi:hypothetical protein ACFO1B_48400 [Dactylosporangium siamense]|uniref:hypothetical protein n=1 Tax=Dactylosporangium siamense TaxID=685454 RepID=UPI001942AB04|nr:hypothetical protein [Dactylosporangium siamense]